MGVYIKSLKMPKECPIRITIYPNGQVIKANAVEYEEFECIPIYPSGDLIDRDAIPWRNANHPTAGKWIDEEHIRIMPAIIEAETLK